MNKQMLGVLGGSAPKTPGIHRIVAKGKWHLPGGRLSASTPIALAFGIDSALTLLSSIALSYRTSTLRIPCGSPLCANFCSIFWGVLKLSVSLFVDLLLFTRQHVARGDVAYGTVKATIVVIAHDLLDDALCLLKRQRALGSKTIARESSVIAFDF